VVEDFIVKREKFIDGLVITGGEPTLQPDLPDYIRRIKSLGFLVKLDTNGSSPKMLKELISQKLVDYIAMDIKAPLDERYHKVTGRPMDLKSVKESVREIINSGIDHEFRTTVCPSFLGEKDIEEIAAALVGAKKYVLQQFVPRDTLDPALEKVAPYPKEELERMAEVGNRYVKTALRGV